MHKVEEVNNLSPTLHFTHLSIMDAYRIDSLPCSALTHIASFLTVPSRALFAVAISTADNELTNADGLAIVGTEWDNVLDFGEIHKDLAAKLTDDHLRCVLLCVDAANRLKRLMLTGCIKITGAGLEPLRGSLVIEQIDLGSMEPSISLVHVLPILDSITKKKRCATDRRCALKFIHFPRSWRDLRWCNTDRDSPYATLQQSILRYNQMWALRPNLLSCFKCSARLPQRKRRNGQWVHDVGGLWIKRKGSQFGIDRHTCYGCLKRYCQNCESESGDEMLGYCDGCDRMYCADCAPILKCVPPEISGDDCHKVCSKCAPKEQICRDCGRFCCGEHLSPCESCGFFCHNCSEDDEAAITCEKCNERLCGGCRSQSASKGIKSCGELSCPVEICNGCRVRYDWGNCALCDGFVKIYLLEEKIGGLAKENKELTEKNKELTDKNKELTDKNEQLRGKMKTIRKIEGKTEQHE